MNYVQSRKDVQYFPSSLSTFTPTTSRVARISADKRHGLHRSGEHQNSLPGAQQRCHPGPQPRHSGALLLHQARPAFCFANAEQLRRPSLARHSASSSSPAALRQLRVNAHQLRSGTASKSRQNPGAHTLQVTSGLRVTLNKIQQVAITA